MGTRRKWKCTTCDEEFLTGQWFGCCGEEGRKHSVAPKKYWSADSLGLVIHWKTDQTVPAAEGKGAVIRIPGAHASFLAGRYTSTDAEEQETLDRNPSLCTEDEFVAKRLSPEIRAQRATTKVTEMQTLLDEQQAELVKLRAEKASSAGDAGGGEKSPNRKR